MSGRVRIALLAAALTAAIAGTASDPAGAGRESPAALERATAPVRELVRTRSVAVPGGGEIARYRQRIAGLPVIGGEAVIAHPAGAEPILVDDRTREGLTPPAPPRLRRAVAIERARSATGAGALRGHPQARLAIDPRSGRAVWEVVIASGRPLADYSTLVDARTGEILRTRDLLHRAGKGAIYLPNPVVQQGAYTGLRDNRDRDSTLLTNLRVPVALERLTSLEGCLSGTYAVARLGEGRRSRPVCREAADFSGFNRSRGQFEAVMAYFHVDATRAYVDSLGLSKGLRAQPQVVEVNSLPDDNSFFSPATRRMGLGTGGVDDAEDADVIVHEYGHSLQDQAVHFFGESYEGASMGEGFGDYIAAVMSARTTGGNPKYDPCMFEWDATSYTANRCLRRTDKPLTKRQGRRRCDGDPHCLGEAWSSALWDLRAALGTDPEGRSVGDRVVLESHFLLTRRANFRAGARALVAADSLLYGGVHAPTITAEMVQRGFCKRAGC
jgi:hypothetical protein